MSTKVWYVEPHDAHTRETMATKIPAKMTHKGVLCEDGKPRNFMEYEYSDIKTFLRHKKILGLHFQVYCHENPHEPAKLWPLFLMKRATIASAHP